MSTESLAVIGGRGNGTVIASTIDDINAEAPQWTFQGFFKDDAHSGELLSGYPVHGRPEDIVGQEYEDWFFVFGLVTLKYGKHNAQRLTDLGMGPERFANVVHPTAVVSQHATLGRGVAIMPLVQVGPGVTVGNHVSLFGSGFVGHDSQIADFGYLANNASIGANVRLEEGAYVGTNSSIRENVTLGAWSVVGMGSVVLEDVPAGAVVVGNPARVIRQRSHERYI